MPGRVPHCRNGSSRTLETVLNKRRPLATNTTDDISYLTLAGEKLSAFTGDTHFYSESRDVFVVVSADVRLWPHQVTGRSCLSGRHQVGFARSTAAFPGFWRGNGRCGEGNACGPGCTCLLLQMKNKILARKLIYRKPDST